MFSHLRLNICKTNNLKFTHYGSSTMSKLVGVAEKFASSMSELVRVGEICNFLQLINFYDNEIYDKFY